MRIYEEKTIKEICCNQCGRKMKVENGIVKEGSFSIDYPWGYFSQKDGMQHAFDLCEACYDAMVEGFLYPVEETETTELL